MLVLVGDHAVGVDETPVGDCFVDERRLGDDRRVARVLHAAVKRLLHADRAVHLERVLVAGQFVLEQHGLLQDAHRLARAVEMAWRHEVLEFHFPVRVGVLHLVRQHLPRARAREEQVGCHRTPHLVDDALASALERAPLHDIAVGDQVRVARVALQHGAERAFRRAVVDDGQDALETVLLALAHVLLRTRRSASLPRGYVAVDALQALAVGMRDVLHRHREPLAGRVFAVERVDHFLPVAVERDLAHRLPRAAVERAGRLHTVLVEGKLQVDMLQLRRRSLEFGSLINVVHHFTFSASSRMRREVRTAQNSLPHIEQ